MSDKWFCKIGDRQYGPLSPQQLKKMAERGQLKPKSRVRAGESGNWVEASQVKGLAFPLEKKLDDLPQAKPLAAAPPPPPPAPLPVAAPVPVAQKIDPEDLAYVEDEGRYNSRVVAWILGGVACLLLIAVGALSVVQFSGNDETPTVDDRPTEDKQQPGIDPEAAPPVAKRADAGTTTVAVEMKREPALDPQTAAIVKSIKSWASPSAIARKGRGSKLVAIRIGGVWSGDRSAVGSTDSVSPGNGGGDGVLDTAALGVTNRVRTNAVGRVISPGDGTHPESGDKNYLFIKLLLTNQSAEDDTTFQGFGQTGDSANPAVIAIDSNGNLCPLIPSPEVSSGDRLSVAEVAAGERTSDLLVFEMPSLEFEFVRLVLSCESVGVPGYVGFQIPRESIVGEESANGPDAGPGAVATAPDAAPPSKSPPDAVRKEPKDADAKAAFDALQQSINQGVDAPHPPVAEPPQE